MATLELDALAEKWPIAGSFVISRGAKTNAHVVVVTLSDGQISGRGECVPYGRYNETVQSVLDQVLSIRPHLANGLDRMGLQSVMPPGAARNALDCAFIDLEAKQSGRHVHAILRLDAPQPLLTAYTISLGRPEEMARDARNASEFPLLKLKLGGQDDIACMNAVRAARPDARLIADANEAWTPKNCASLLESAKTARFELIEQPLPAEMDICLSEIDRQVPVCADESMHSRRGLAALKDRYDAVNIKLDKTGGLTEAIEAVDFAQQSGFHIMLGCMVCTSLSIAPAFLLGRHADWVDLDGPLLLTRDRFAGITQVSGIISPPGPDLWG